MVGMINGQVKSDSEISERIRLETIHGKVWDTEQLSKDFIVEDFMAPFIVVYRKVDNKKGTMLFQHHPRFYFAFDEV